MNGPVWLASAIALVAVALALIQWRACRSAEDRLAELERIREAERAKPTPVPVVAAPAAPPPIAPPPAPRDDGPSLAEARLALASAPSGIAILGPDHRYRWANAAHLALVGGDLASLRALSYQGVTGPDDVDTEMDALAGLHQGRVERISWRRRFGANGSRRWCEVTAHALRAADGELDAMLWLVHADGAAAGPSASSGTLDLELREAREDLQRVAALLSHDAIQPTRMISSYAGLLEQRLAGQAEAELKHLTAVQRASDDLRELLREAVIFLRVPKALRVDAPVRLQPCVEAVAGRLAKAIPGLTVRCPEDPVLPLEAEDLERCLHGAIALAGARSASGVVEITIAVDGPRHRLTVLAPGGALHDGDADRVFLLGARIGLNEGAGSLLPGLCVARRIAERSGGDLTVDDEGGVRVTLRLGPG